MSDSMDDYQDYIFDHGLSSGQNKQRKYSFSAGDSELSDQEIVDRNSKKIKLKAKSSTVIDKVRDENEVKEKIED